MAYDQDICCSNFVLHYICCIHGMNILPPSKKVVHVIKNDTELTFSHLVIYLFSLESLVHQSINLLVQWNQKNLSFTLKADRFCGLLGWGVKMFTFFIKELYKNDWLIYKLTGFISSTHPRLWINWSFPAMWTNKVHVIYYLKYWML